MLVGRDSKIIGPSSKPLCARAPATSSEILSKSLYESEILFSHSITVLFSKFEAAALTISGSIKINAISS